MRLEAPALAAIGSVRHGFFGRPGGVSGGIYASLNCGFGSGDGRDNVATNRARALAALDLGPEALVTAYQVHSAEVVRVTDRWDPAEAPRADAMVTTRPDIALGILAADCAPVLLADATAGVIGAAHAGWRGALSGIVENTVAAMTALGARAGRITAAIGPCIARESYEVGPEFPAPFLSEDAANRAYLTPAPGEGRWLFDLVGFVSRRLEQAGVARVTATGHDTCAARDSFFSYRRSRHEDEADYGRNLSAIALGGAGR